MEQQLRKTNIFFKNNSIEIDFIGKKCVNKCTVKNKRL